mmetsp:Transcript_59425/g.89633  ORF Transcript_59425/g.89633 Transcript_59425/m.89633 type:complete len:84 (+) Transcript_59425:201-452(+)
MDLCKDNKALFTNRALAYNKIKKWTKAIADCTRILEFIECFEDGYTKSRDLSYKAFIRRAFAWKEEGNFEEALNDIKEAKILI